MKSSLRIVTSYSGRLFYATGRDALLGWKDTFPYPITAYHEDSYENTNPLSARHICEVDKVSNADYVDVFKVDPDLQKIVDYPEFKSSKKYLNQNAPYFFRKIAAIRHAMENCEEDYLMWLDCDCFARAPLSTELLTFVSQHDICYLDRENYPTESGIFFFNIRNPDVKNLINAWYNLYLTKNIFKLEDWADHNAFDHVKESYPFLKFGRLQSGIGRKLWFKPEYVNTKTAKAWSVEEGWKFFYHLKHPLKAVRKPVETKQAGGINRGHLLISFGREYDNVAAHSAAYMRRCSDLPIHVVTNLDKDERSAKWKEVNNISFRYYAGEDHDNRDVKTALSFFSPFDETVYTDADSLTHSANFKRPFKELKSKDVLVPPYALKVHPNRIPQYQHAAFAKALKQLDLPNFSIHALFDIYGGGVCYFRKSEATTKFFGMFNYFWKELGRGRDMPALSAAIAEASPECSFGLLSKEYNLVTSKIIQSIHGNATSPYLPHYTPYRPDEHGLWSFQPKVKR